LKNHSEPFEAKRFFLGMLGAIILVFCLSSVFAILGHLLDYLPDRTQFSSPEAPGIEGQKGYIISDMVACPKLDDLKSTLNAMIASAKVKDRIGFNNDLMSAIDNDGCRKLQTGQSGLVIDSVGYYFGYTEIRMDDDETAYWIDNEYVGAMEAPNWDFRRLFWGLSVRIRSALM
jgi:hypothetical protein